MYIITGATGNIGKIVAKNLLADGKQVKVIGRSLDKLQDLVDLGAVAAIGDLTDSDFVNAAFVGATAAYLMIPPNNFAEDFYLYQKQVANNLLDAIEENEVKNVLILSSVGAHLRNGCGVVDGLGYLEELFAGVEDINVLNLRPSFFMENIFGQIGIIKHAGIAGSLADGNVAFPVVATKDIAAVASKRLSELSFRGNTIEYVLGAKDVTYNEITKIIGSAIGKPDLQYVQFSAEDSKQGMINAGFCGESVAEGMNQLMIAMNNGTMLNAYTRTAENTTPTTVEEFAQIFAYVYNS